MCHGQVKWQLCWSFYSDRGIFTHENLSLSLSRPIGSETCGTGILFARSCSQCSDSGKGGGNTSTTEAWSVKMSKHVKAINDASLMVTSYHYHAIGANKRPDIRTTVTYCDCICIRAYRFWNMGCTTRPRNAFVLPAISTLRNLQVSGFSIVFNCCMVSSTCMLHHCPGPSHATHHSRPDTSQPPLGTLLVQRAQDIASPLAHVNVTNDTNW